MSKFCFGVDIGGTTVKMGIFSVEGSLLEKWEIPTVGETVLKDVAAEMVQKFEGTYSKEDCVGIGIDVPGPVTGDGVVSTCVNLHWGIVDVKKEMETLTGIKTFVGNDANAAALGEQWQGGGKGHNNLVMITLGTGVGGGVIVDGKIIAGAAGAAGEIGHICVNPEETLRCNCGKPGCLEQYASATGIVRLAKKALVEGSYQTTLIKDENLTAKALIDAAKAGDELGVYVLHKLGFYLGLAAAHIAQVVDPEVFVIGGGVSKAGEIITKTVETYYNKFVMDALKGKEFKLAELGNDAGIYGCAAMVAGKEIK